MILNDVGVLRKLKETKMSHKCSVYVGERMQSLEWHSLELWQVGYLNWIRSYSYRHRCFSHVTDSLWPFTMESWVQFQVSPWGVCDGQSSTGLGLFPSTSGFHHLYHSTSSAHTFIHLPPTPHNLNNWSHHFLSCGILIPLHHDPKRGPSNGCTIFWSHSRNLPSAHQTLTHGMVVDETQVYQLF
jgi:hypothetical protein